MQKGVREGGISEKINIKYDQIQMVVKATNYIYIFYFFLNSVYEYFNNSSVFQVSQKKIRYLFICISKVYSRYLSYGTYPSFPSRTTKYSILTFAAGKFPLPLPC